MNPSVSFALHRALDDPGFPPLDCPTLVGCKDLSLLASELQLTHGQAMMWPWLIDHDCCLDAGGPGSHFGILDVSTCHWAAVHPCDTKKSYKGEWGC